MVSNRGVSLAFYEISHEKRVRIMHNIITVLYTIILRYCNKRTDGRTSDSEFTAKWSLRGDAFSNEMLFRFTLTDFLMMFYFDANFLTIMFMSSDVKGSCNKVFCHLRKCN